MSERTSPVRLAAMVVGAVITVAVAIAVVVVTGGSADDSRLDEMANDPLLVNTPVPAEVLEQATVAPAREDAFGVREEFHTAIARWSVPLPLNETAGAWANSLVDNDVWHDVVAVCRVYADGERQTGLGARRSAGRYTVSANIDLAPTDADTTEVSVVLVVPVKDDGERTTDAPPDLACLE